MLFIILPAIFLVFFICMLILSRRQYQNDLLSDISDHIRKTSNRNFVFCLTAFGVLLINVVLLFNAKERNQNYQEESLVLLSSYRFESITTNTLVKQAEYTVLFAEAHKHNLRYAERLRKRNNLWDGYKYRIGYDDKRVDRFFHPFSAMPFTEDLLDVSLDTIEKDTYSLYIQDYYDTTKMDEGNDGN